MMELKVENSTLAAYGGRWETRLELPVETEILIPDYLPAVFKIVKCMIEPVVLHNAVAGARWQGDGYLRCTVLYQSDEAGARLWRTEQKFSFEKTAELPAGRYAAGPAQIWGEVEYCNCRAISEHRIDLRGAYTLCVAALAVQEHELPAALSDCGIEQRPLTLSGVVLSAASEKTYTAQASFPLPGAGEAILSMGGCFIPQGVTVQNGQISCQGILRLEIVWRGEGEETFTVRQKEQPVQLTMDVEGAAEGDDCTCWGEVLSASLAAPEGNETDPTMTATWMLHAELWRPVACSAIADAYSTLCETTVTTVDCQLLHKQAALDLTVPVVVEDELPDPDLVVYGCFVTLGAVGATRCEAAGAPPATGLVGKGVAHLLCADGRGEMACYDKPFSYQLPETWPGEPGVFLPRVGVHVSQVNSGRNGTKMRVDLEVAVHGLLLQVQSCPVVSDVALGEEFTDKAEGPALYLYYARAGERLFDIAKRYHARAGDLLAANKLNTEDEAPQTTAEPVCLLVPAAL